MAEDEDKEDKNVMKAYKVTMTGTISVVAVISATSEEEACNKASDLWPGIDGQEETAEDDDDGAEVTFTIDSVDLTDKSAEKA